MTTGRTMETTSGRLMRTMTACLAAAPLQVRVGVRVGVRVQAWVLPAAVQQ
jgi:hypothetical protein